MDDDLAAAMADFQACVESRNPIAADAVLDRNFALVLVQPAPAVMLRDRWLEVLPDYVVHAYASGPADVAMDGDVVVVLHKDEMTATVLGEDRSGTFVITDVWRRRDDGWRLWRRHSTPLHAGRLAGA